jgi:HSP20 family molecular chaperone IbpA
MALFPIYQYRLHADPIERFIGDQLDCFDPWENSDSHPTRVVIVPKSFHWVNEPQPHTAHQRHHPAKRSVPHAQKFRVQLNVAGYDPKTIKTRVEGQKVIIEAKQEERQSDGDFHVREFRKSYPLPEHAGQSNLLRSSPVSTSSLLDVEHLTSYVTPNHMLLIEIPIRKPDPPASAEPKNLHQFGENRDPLFDYLGFVTSSDFQPRIIDKDNNEKQLEMMLEMKKYQPEEIKVSVKNDELIVKGEHRHDNGNHFERSFFFKSTKLPPGSQIDQLQSFLTDDGHLKIQVPFVAQQASLVNVPEQAQKGQDATQPVAQN